nr:EOG090X047D [Lepidurus arcticus]
MAMRLSKLSEEELEDGKKQGIYVEGILRINPKNYKEAYTTAPENGESDILIEGMEDRNRALNGDVVVVQLKPASEWKQVEKTAPVQAKPTNPTQPPRDQNCEGNSSLTKDKKCRRGKRGSGKSKSDETEKVTERTKSETIVVESAMQNLSLTSACTIKQNVTGKPRKIGKVVIIREYKHTRVAVGTIKPHPRQFPGFVFFVPRDHRFPRLNISLKMYPGLGQRLSVIGNVLFLVRLIGWEEIEFPIGEITQELGHCGELGPELGAITFENAIDDRDFDPSLLTTPPLPQITREEISQRRDFRETCVVTIDPHDAKDLDDAVSCVPLPSGNFRVGVHIADVSYFVADSTKLDIEASIRATSTYLVHKVIPMLPRELCQDLCSLNPGEERLTFSVEWELNPEGEILNECFGRSVIKSAAKLSYEHAQAMIETAKVPENMPTVVPPTTAGEICSAVLNLQNIAVKLRQGRERQGALRIDNPKVYFRLDEDTRLPESVAPYVRKESHKLIEEFMLLANMRVAKRICEAFPDLAVLRHHPPPQLHILQEAVDTLGALDVLIDHTDSLALQTSMAKHSVSDCLDVASQAKALVVTNLLSKALLCAKYICAGRWEPSDYRHFALSVDMYTHFTSPIRRYPDILVHRLLAAALEYRAKPTLAQEIMHRTLEHCNDRKLAAKTAQDSSIELFFAMYLKHRLATSGPLPAHVAVLGVLDHSCDVVVLELGFLRRLYLDKLPVTIQSFKRVGDKGPVELTIIWNAEENHPAVEQRIRVMSVLPVLFILKLFLPYLRKFLSLYIELTVMFSRQR